MERTKRQKMIDSGEILGVELILDLYNCNTDKFNKESLEKFMYDLCEHIDMNAVQVHTWEYLEDNEKTIEDFEHLKGYSIVLFLKTSNITLHNFDNLGKVSLNIYSCKDFDEQKAKQFCKAYFSAQIRQAYCILRF